GPGREGPRGAGRARRADHRLRAPREAGRPRGRLRGGSAHQGHPQGAPQARPERRGHRRPGADAAVRHLGGSAGAVGGRPPAHRGGPGGRRGLQRPGGSLRRRAGVRRPAHHVNTKARRELIGIGARVVGLFLGLTLFRLPITGSWGERVGGLLWRVFGVGSVLVPAMGVGWALAAFQRLGSLSAARAAALGAGLILLVPYGIGTITGAGVPAGFADWTPTSQLVGMLPAVLARAVHRTVGTAGGVLVGVLAVSALDTLQTFRVEGSIAGRTVGPVVTQYEVAPGPGVKVGRIAALADDLALAMRAPSLRIVAPIPGKAAVGIEVPNPMPRMVHIRELVEGAEYHRGTRVLPVALGKNLEGDPVVADLAKMPHLLIAGVTGSGKSVCINTVITSLLYTHPPERIKLLMVDPKMVELS